MARAMASPLRVKNTAISRHTRHPSTNGHLGFLHGPLVGGQTPTTRPTRSQPTFGCTLGSLAPLRGVCLPSPARLPPTRRVDAATSTAVPLVVPWVGLVVGLSSSRRSRRRAAQRCPGPTSGSRGRQSGCPERSSRRCVAVGPCVGVGDGQVGPLRELARAPRFDSTRCHPYCSQPTTIRICYRTALLAPALARLQAPS